MTQINATRQNGEISELGLAVARERLSREISAKKVLLPDLRFVQVKSELVTKSIDQDVWCDDFELMIEPKYEQLYACTLETIVNAGLCRSSGSQRFLFVLNNLSLRRARGDLFDWDELFIDRHAEERDWRKVKTFCDVFTDNPPRYMNRLKERIHKPRQELLDVHTDDHLLRRLGYIALAVKVFLAHAGYPEFCQRREAY